MKIAKCHILQIFILCMMVSCGDSLSVTLTKSPSRLAVISKVNTVVASPNDIVRLQGERLKPGQRYIARFTTAENDIKETEITVLSATEASFVMPKGLGLGVKKFEVFQSKTKLKELEIVANDPENKLPIYTSDPSKICDDLEFIDRDGVSTKGTRNCTQTNLASCSADGEIDCKSNQSFKAVNTASLLPQNILSGVTMGGVTGSLIVPSNCAGDNLQGCVTTPTYRSANFSTITPGNIKSGVTIGGVTGDFPSSTYTLAGADATADLDAATFNAKVKSATAFEYWTSSGDRQTGAGDSDISATNIKSTVSIFGETGSYSAAAPNSWDLRAGVSVGGVTGKLKVDCRSAANHSYVDIASSPLPVALDHTMDVLAANNHGLAENDQVRFTYNTAPTGIAYNVTYYARNVSTHLFQISTSSGGAALDFSGNGTSVFVSKWGGGSTEIWDTIDDYYVFAPTVPTYSGWTSDHLCGGVEGTADDSNVWKDVTTTGDGVTASSCATTGAHCSMLDKITNKEWSKDFSISLTNSSITSGSALVTVSSTANLYPGMYVSGAGIPSDTYIVSIGSATTFNMSANATANSSTLTITANLASWSGAMSFCDGVTHNGKTDWRLPTQKEWLAAYNHGIMSTAGRTNWISTFNNNYWTSSTFVDLMTHAWFIYPAYGAASANFKHIWYRIVCIRP